MSLTALVVVIGVAASLGAGTMLWRSVHRAADQSMTARTDLIAAAVTTEVARYLNQLGTLAGSLGAVDALTAPRFERATRSLARMDLPGATSISYLVPGHDADVAALQARWRGRGVTGLTLQPKGHGLHLFAVLSRVLSQEPTRIPGIDASQAAEPTAAMLAALRDNRATVSDTYQLLIDQRLEPAKRQHSFVLVAPVTGTSAGRPEFRGWLLMGLRSQDFMNAVLAHTAQDVVDVDLSARNADGALVQVATRAAKADGDRDLHRTRTVDVAQRRWVLRTDAVGGTLPGGSTRSALAMSAAMLLLTALIATLATGRARARRTVAGATAELRRAGRESGDQARLLTTILDTLTDGVAVVDQDGRFILNNPAGLALLGVDRDSEAAPDGWQAHYGLFRPDGVTPFPVAETPLLLALGGATPTRVEILIRRPDAPDGSLLSVTARQVTLADGSHGAMAVYHDITSDRAHETELAGFAGIVAHDLKSPLTSVVGHAELLEDSILEELTGPARATALTSLNRIQATAYRMRTLIDGLLAYTTSRDARLQLVTVDLDTLAREVVTARVDAIRDTGRRPDVHLGPLPPVHADPLLIRQVLDNLVGNALKYTPPGRAARVDISGRPDRLRGGKGPAVRIEVADRGIGIPAGEHGKVFARFHRAHTEGEYAGTGLGLAICHRIVERHGGSVGVTDNPGGGACFWFTLPAADPDGEPAAAGARRLDPVAAPRA